MATRRAFSSETSGMRWVMPFLNPSAPKSYELPHEPRANSANPIADFITNPLDGPMTIDTGYPSKRVWAVAIAGVFALLLPMNVQSSDAGQVCDGDDATITGT